MNEHDLSTYEQRLLESDPAAFVAQVRMSVRLAAHYHDPADRRVVERTRALLDADAGLRTMKAVQRRIGVRPASRTRWVWAALAAAGVLVAALFALRPAPPKVEHQVHVAPVEPPPRPEEKPAVVVVPDPPKPAPAIVNPVDPLPTPDPVPPTPVPEPPRPAPSETRVAVAQVEGRDLLEGDGVKTRAGEQVAIVFADRTRLEVGPGTTIRGLTLKGGKKLSLDRGTLKAQVVPQAEPMEVTTPHGSATVLGTTLRLAVGDATRVDVTEGKVRVKREAASVDVGAGEYAVAAPGRDLVSYASPVIIDLDEFGTGRDCAPLEGSAKKLYRDVSLGATGGTCVAAPGIGTTLEGALPVTPGSWHLWIRYRDNDQGPIGFQVLIDGRAMATINGEGLLKRPGWEKWNWRRVSFDAKNKSPRLALRSLSEASGWDRPDLTWIVANRWDLIVLTRDPEFDPR